MNQPRIFLGNVMHRRLRPVVNAFVYPVFYIQLPVRNPALASLIVRPAAMMNWWQSINTNWNKVGGLVEDLLPNQFPKTMEKKIFLTTSISQ